MFDIAINGVSMKSKGFFVTKRPDENTPAKKMITHEVLSKDGTIYRDTGKFEDVTQDIEFNFMTTPEDWHEKIRQFRGLVMSAEVMTLSDDQGYFRKIKAVSIGTFSRPSRGKGVATVTFTLDPFCYLEKGRQFVRIRGSSLFNAYGPSLPCFRFDGYGDYEMTVNGYTFTATIPGTLFVDIEKGIAYGEDGRNLNANTNADFSKLILQAGENAINCVGCDMSIRPNWRSL